jgi:hypothetical protein
MPPALLVQLELRQHLVEFLVPRGVGRAVKLGQDAAEFLEVVLRGLVASHGIARAGVDLQIEPIAKVQVPAAQDFSRIRCTLSILHTASRQIAARPRVGEDGCFRLADIKRGSVQRGCILGCVRLRLDHKGLDEGESCYG